MILSRDLRNDNENATWEPEVIEKNKDNSDCSRNRMISVLLENDEVLGLEVVI